MIVAYFKCGEGVQGKTNAALWAGLIAFVNGVNQPVIIMGDFNITPGEFMATIMRAVTQAQMVATGEETCSTGNELDWALVSNQLSPDIMVQTCWEVLFKPHAQLNFKLAVEAEAMVVQQITRFNPAPKFGRPAKEWAQFEMVEKAVNWLDMETRKSGALYGKIENCALQNLDNPTKGRGVKLQLQQKPLSDPSKPWLWKKGSLSYWNQMELRLQQVAHRDPAMTPPIGSNRTTGLAHCAALASVCCSTCSGDSMIKIMYKLFHNMPSNSVNYTNKQT